jgi:hypothetical protein
MGIKVYSSTQRLYPAKVDAKIEEVAKGDFVQGPADVTTLGVSHFIVPKYNNKSNEDNLYFPSQLPITSQRSQPIKMAANILDLTRNFVSNIPAALASTRLISRYDYYSVNNIPHPVSG